MDQDTKELRMSEEICNIADWPKALPVKQVLRASFAVVNLVLLFSRADLLGLADLSL